MAMKRKEIVLWTLVAVALAANIWLPRQMRYKYSWDKDLAQRLATEFRATREDVKEYIQKYVPDVTDEQIDKWTASGELEAMQIGKRTMYFTAAARNLFRINPELAAIKAAADSKDEDLSKSGTSLSGHEAIDAVTIPEIKRQVLENLADGKENPYFALPKRMKVTFTLTVHANTLRPGQTLRCWLPLPRKDVPRQSDVKFIEAGANGVAYPSEKLTFSSPSNPHASVYLEAKTARNKPPSSTRSLNMSPAANGIRSTRPKYSPTTRRLLTITNIPPSEASTSSSPTGSRRPPTPSPQA